MFPVKDSTGRYFSPHYLWEDYLNGGYNLTIDKSEKPAILSKELLINPINFFNVMETLENEWPYCFKQNVSNRTINRKAWLGQAACLYNHGATFAQTIKGWYKMSDIQQLEANNAAQRIINIFEEKENAKNTTRDECFRRCQRTRDMDF